MLLGFALALVGPILSGKVPVAVDTLALWGPQAIIHPQPVHNGTLADSALIFLPWQVFIRRSLAGGEWPLWYPDIFAGYPFAGNPQTQLYYPVMWLLWLLPLPTALQVSAVFHLWLAGAGMFVLARVLGTSRTGSLLAGLAFAGSGQLYMAIEITGVADIYGWLPWVLAATEIAWRRRSGAWTAGAGLLFGVLALSGHLQWFLYSSLLLGSWLGARLVVAGWSAWQSRSPHEWRAWAGQLVRAGAILAWGPGLAAAQIFPFLELVQYTTRASSTTQISYEPLDHLLRLLVPQLFGTSVGSIGEPLLFNNCWYIGLAPLALAVVAVVIRRGRRVLFLALAGLSALGVAAGAPLFDQFQHLPGFQAQLPQRIAYLFIFCAATLTGLGFDALLKLARQRPARAGALIGLLIVAALELINLLVQHQQASPDGSAVYQLQATALHQAALVAGALGIWAMLLLVLRGDRLRSGRAVLSGLLLGITVVDLLSYAPDYNTYVSADSLQLRTRAANVMRADPGPWRMLGVDSYGPMFVPNSATLYGIQDVQGYDSLHLARYEDFWASSDPRIHEGTYFNVMLRPQSYLSAAANLLNVKYLAAGGPLNIIQQTQADRTLTELADRPITQTLLAPANLSSLKIAFDTLGRVNHGPVTLHLRRSLTATTDLITQTVDPSPWRGQPWITFTFPPLPVQGGDPLVLILESPGRAGDTVAVRSSRDDSYPEGTLYRVGAARAFDLGFVAKGMLPSSLAPIYNDRVVVYSNTAALPRAFVVGGAEVLPAATIPARIAQPGFDPRRAVLLEQPPPAGFATPPADLTPPGQATITQYRNLSVDLTAQMDRPGWLVLGDVNYPGWQVTVDGRPAPLYTAYYILRAVPLPAGPHQVHFEFRPLSVLIGGAISTLALLAALAVLGRSLWPRRARA
ncbi:MAG TPA: YfhO family protein [Chloroflexia bacterium]|nr:YfhO family protein [Chloroflexia bacterium]